MDSIDKDDENEPSSGPPADYVKEDSPTQAALLDRLAASHVRVLKALQEIDAIEIRKSELEPLAELGPITARAILEALHGSRCTCYLCFS